MGSLGLDTLLQEGQNQIHHLTSSQCLRETWSWLKEMMRMSQKLKLLREKKDYRKKNILESVK